MTRKILAAGWWRAGRRIKHRLQSAGVCIVLMGAALSAAAEPLLDCPLRDAPFSVDMALIDALLSPAASAAINEQMPDLFAGLPAIMKKTETPSFAAIMSVRGLANMKRQPEENILALDKKLRQLTVTDKDRRARCARYDNDVPALATDSATVNILVFNKINGFDHGPSVGAATAALQAIAKAKGWSVAVTDKGGAFNTETLDRFDVVVWNNISGDALTLSQRAAFKQYIEQGGGFLGIHGSGGDPIYFWNWYADTLLGARFIGHPMEPQFQDAGIAVENTASGIGASLKPGWSMKDEWYSFAKSPRGKAVTVVAILDESTYSPKGMFGQDLHMGEDHPIAWSRCVKNGRAFYTAIGHRPEVYSVKENITLLTDALAWAAGQGKTQCRNGKEVAVAH